MDSWTRIIRNNVTNATAMEAILSDPPTGTSDILDAIRGRDQDIFQRYRLKEMVREVFDEEFPVIPDDLKKELGIVAVYVEQIKPGARGKAPLTMDMFTDYYKRTFKKRPTVSDFEKLSDGFYYVASKHRRGYKTFL